MRRGRGGRSRRVCVEQAVAPARNGHSTEAIPTNGVASNGVHPPRTGAALPDTVRRTLYQVPCIFFRSSCRASAGLPRLGNGAGAKQM